MQLSAKAIVYLVIIASAVALLISIAFGGAVLGGLALACFTGWALLSISGSNRR